MSCFSKTKGFRRFGDVCFNRLVTFQVNRVLEGNVAMITRSPQSQNRPRFISTPGFLLLPQSIVGHCFFAESLFFPWHCG